MARNNDFESLFNTPNLISYSRVILLLPIILFYPNRWLMLFLFSLAAVSDWYDGFVARKQGLATKLGAIIDPLCDKILFAGLIFFFYGKGDISTFQLITLFVRDLFVLGIVGFTYILTMYDRRLKRLKSMM
ncbi:TPA: hypothetical protein HA265_01575 [Candidatus Woesearchaeota archaeon]|nr:hypothetical protein [Candidatus Woesearchaeota archaeon]